MCVIALPKHISPAKNLLGFAKSTAYMTVNYILRVPTKSRSKITDTDIIITQSERSTESNSPLGNWWTTQMLWLPAVGVFVCCDCCCAGNKLTYFSTLHDFPHPGAHTLNLAAFLFAHTHDTRWAVGGFGLLKGQRQGIFGPSRIYIPHWRIGLDLCPYFSILRILHISHIFFIIFASKSRRTKKVCTK